MTFLKTTSGQKALVAPSRCLDQAPPTQALAPRGWLVPRQQDSLLSPPVLGGKVCREEMIRNSKSVGTVHGKRSRKPNSTLNKGTAKVTTWGRGLAPQEHVTAL